MSVGRELALPLPGRPAAGQFSEPRLVALLKERSTVAWAALYDAHYGHVYRHALTRLGSVDQAEDVAATVFQRALTAIDGYSYQGKPLLAWLYSISRNVVSEHQRASQRRRVLSLFRTSPATMDGSAAQSPLDGARTELRAARGCEPEAAIGRLDLQRALPKLTSGQREVLILRHFVGLSTREVADVLGKRERAVHAILARAVESLRRYLR
jgi:RNA polymerase sigma-70 factor (ECF subfamily)